VKVRDIITRNLCGKTMQMKVTAVDDFKITAGMGWMFERATGFEYDPDLHWGTEWGATGSFLE